MDSEERVYSALRIYYAKDFIACVTFVRTFNLVGQVGLLGFAFIWPLQWYLALIVSICLLKFGSISLLTMRTRFDRRISLEMDAFRRVFAGKIPEDMKAFLNMFELYARCPKPEYKSEITRIISRLWKEYESSRRWNFLRDLFNSLSI
ncbi:hypothetical protein HYW53_03580 [Candidatus Giovannonibacteria bacterium]|nr:hypothetical protein [Candidatus Giovannonibacteria bacterium]